MAFLPDTNLWISLLKGRSLSLSRRSSWVNEQQQFMSGFGITAVSGLQKLSRSW
jgi:hypothetical protein